jgi:hypothetical protein
LHLICGFGGVLAIGGKSPSDIVINMLIELNGGQERPQLEELVEVVDGEALFKINLCDPRVVMQGFGDHPIFALGDLKDKRGHINRSPPIILIYVFIYEGYIN